jgi:putative ATP-binding cassette transporter
VIRIDDVCVAAPEIAIRLSDPHVELRPGQRVLVGSERGAERTLAFRAMIGIWPWGSGRITHPPRQAMMFLPASAYVPPDTLRAALAYPHAAAEYTDAAIGQALTDVGLERLQPQLDTVERWDRQLNDDEKQCLAFARVLLQRPQWVVGNGAFDVLDSASRKRIEALFAGQLAGVGVIDFGPDIGQEGFFTRRLRLVTDPEGPCFKTAAQPGQPAAVPA